MKRFLLIVLLLGAQLAYAYEYKLQFTPQSGARGLVVAGYQFVGNTVVGSCSYYSYSVSSGRGGHSVRINHYGSCSWDLYGNLISLTPTATVPAAPPVLSVTGTETIYAVSGTSSTGSDSRGFGFVNTPAAHYTWQTPNGSYADINYVAYPITATLVSDGDIPLVITAGSVVASVSGFYTPTPGTATITATTCAAPVPVGGTCSVTVTYNPATIQCTASPYGYAYTKIDLSLVTNAGANTDFTEGFTIMGVPICDD